MRVLRHRSCAPRGAALLLLAGVLGALACGEAADPRPSMMVVVVDTLRSSAVSAHGTVEGTTPGLDALAAEGLDYRSAWAPAPWTLPSHASLFSGLDVDAHGVGLGGRLDLPEEIETVAERLSAAGYDTAAFAENMLVSDTFHLLQGFAHRRHNQIYKKEETGLAADIYYKVDLEKELRSWLDARDPHRPFFVFVNIFDAHNPYEVRDENPWVQEGLSRAEMSRYAKEPQQNLCDLVPGEADLEILHGLYLGDVAAADAKVSRLRDVVAEHRVEGQQIITVVTSDHGELFGERRLLGHEFTLHNGLLHVPLIVQGLDVPPAAVEAPVSLMDLSASLLAWAGVEADDALDGRPLPTRPAGPDASGGDAPASRRALFAAYSDQFFIDPDAWSGVIEFLEKDYPRRGCDADEDKVFGDMGAWLDPPWKLHWFERYAPELYDLRWDPEERFDVADQYPERVARYGALVEKRLREGVARAKQGATGLDREAVEALEALGYAE